MRFQGKPKGGTKRWVKKYALFPTQVMDMTIIFEHYYEEEKYCTGYMVAHWKGTGNKKLKI